MNMPADQMQQGISGAVDQGVRNANGAQETPQVELDEVKKLTDEYREARDFDEYARRQYNIDRRYAAGTQDQRWASDANIIGAYIDILVAFLYAQNPDVSAKAAAQAGGNHDANIQMFSETLQIVVSRLWKDARLKKTMRRDVRSVLSVGVGWFKAIMYSETKQNPALEKQMSDMRDQLEQIQGIKLKLQEDGDTEGSAEYEEKTTEMQRLLQGLQGQVETQVKKGLCIDFVRAEDMQMSLDVASTEEYLDADWLSNDMYIRKSAAIGRFPRLTEEDLKTATIFYQRQTGPGDKENATPVGQETSAEGQYTRSVNGAPQSSGGKPIEFVKVVELWDHRDCLIKTFVDGVKKWAREPYSPPQASTRFYPYFRLAFFETDGTRHPQSLAYRLRKLQDEYASTRSAGLLTKNRSIPGTIFHKGQLDPEDVKRLEQSEHMEMVGLNPTTNELALDKLIAAKPIPRVDPMMFDTMACQRDMEVISGVQEAQSQAVQTEKTATEAEIEQSGFHARTGADRDNTEEMLSDLAQYTAEVAVQSLSAQDAMRYAGPLAFWPEGMNVEDVLSMVSVEITAGTTGKPQQRQDKEAWATLLPLVQNMLTQITQMDVINPPLAKAYRALLQETLRRLDDRIDIDTIVPPAPKALPGTMPGQPMPGMMPPPAPGGAPPVGNGTVNNPVVHAPPGASPPAQ